MIENKGDVTTITMDLDELTKSIAILEEMKEFYQKEKQTESIKDITKALEVAIEAMMGYACENFEDELKKPDDPVVCGNCEDTGTIVALKDGNHLTCELMDGRPIWGSRPDWCPKNRK